MNIYKDRSRLNGYKTQENSKPKKEQQLELSSSFPPPRTFTVIDDPAPSAPHFKPVPYKRIGDEGESLRVSLKYRIKELEDKLGQIGGDQELYMFLDLAMQQIIGIDKVIDNGDASSEILQVMEDVDIIEKNINRLQHQRDKISTPHKHFCGEPFEHFEMHQRGATVGEWNITEGYAYWRKASRVNHQPQLCSKAALQLKSLEDKIEDYKKELMSIMFKLDELRDKISASKGIDKKQAAEITEAHRMILEGNYNALKENQIPDSIDENIRAVNAHLATVDI